MTINGISYISCFKLRRACLIRQYLELRTKRRFFKVPTLGDHGVSKETNSKYVLVPFCSNFCVLFNDI